MSEGHARVGRAKAIKVDAQEEELLYFHPWQISPRVKAGERSDWFSCAPYKEIHIGELFYLSIYRYIYLSICLFVFSLQFHFQGHWLLLW